MRVVDAAATGAALPWNRLIPALRDAFIAGVEAPPRHRHTMPGGTLLLMPAWQADWLGVKIVTVHPGNAAQGLPAVHSTYLLSDARTGRPVAMLDGDTLTERRTAAASALAASYLARPGASRLLLVGAGRVARLLAPAYAAVRDLQHVEVWSRTPSRSDALVAELRAAGFEAMRADDLQAAVGRADIVSCATLAMEPLVHGAWLRPGTHLDLIGAFTPAMREADTEAVARAAVFVDTEAALSEAGELAGFKATDLRGTLATLCRGGAGRKDTAEVTLFKSVGAAIEDLAAAVLAWSGVR